MQCLIIAGGLATRLRPITEKIPKSMVPVHGRPFLEYQLSLLRRNGIEDFVMCVGFLGEQIEDYFGNGSEFGVNIKYSYEKDKLLGTGGAVRNALDLVEDEIFIMYGDSYLDINYKEVFDYFLSVEFPALMTTFKNDDRWDRSNVVFKNNIVELYDKKKQIPQMEYIDYGLSVLTKDVIKEIPVNTVYDLSDMFNRLSIAKQLAGFEVFTRFYEIGSKDGLDEFSGLISEKGV